MPKMFVTILNLDTEACQASSVAIRKMVFEEVLQEVNTTVAKKMGPADNGRRVWNLFVAPEYCFANPLDHNNHEPGDVRHLSEGTKVALEKWLKGLSVKHPKTLLFPGSIAWKKSLTRDLSTYLRNKKSVNGKVDEKELARHFQTKAETRTQKSLGLIHNHINQFMAGNPLRQVAGNMYGDVKACIKDDTGNFYFETNHPSGFWYDGKRWTPDYNLAIKDVRHAAPTNQQKLNELGGGLVTHMARNTCLIYLNGKKMGKYHKAQDYHEVLDNRGDTVYVPGNSIPTFKVDNLVYGVEICLDHVFGSLNARVPMGQTPDVVVLMSAKVKFNPANLPNPGAMVIHACSLASWSFVGRGGAADVGCTRESPTTVADYSLYSFDVP